MHELGLFFKKLPGMLAQGGTQGGSQESRKTLKTQDSEWVRKNM